MTRETRTSRTVSSKPRASSGMCRRTMAVSKCIGSAGDARRDLKPMGEPADGEIDEEIKDADGRHHLDRLEGVIADLGRDGHELTDLDQPQKGAAVEEAERQIGEGRDHDLEGL